jgi:hypothetical protein
MATRARKRAANICRVVVCEFCRILKFVVFRISALVLLGACGSTALD